MTSGSREAQISRQRCGAAPAGRARAFIHALSYIVLALHNIVSGGRMTGFQKGTAMRWYHYISYFFAGAFLANAIPHFVNGVSGNAFQSPFASPPGIGLSSSTVNVYWGLFNLAVGYILVCRVGTFDLRKTRHVLILGVGILVMSVMLAHAFGRFHGGLCG